MDQSGVPIEACFLCMCYVIALLNHCATESLNWRSPIKACYEYNLDISHLLQYEFFEPINFLDVYQDKGKTCFLKSDEKFRYWCGPCDNNGDAFTYWILLFDGRSTVARSVLRSAKYDTHLNKLVNPAHKYVTFQ